MQPPVNMLSGPGAGKTAAVITFLAGLALYLATRPKPEPTQRR